MNFREGMIKSPVIIGRINKNHVSMNTEHWQKIKSEIIRNINNVDELRSNLQSINKRDISNSVIKVVRELLEDRIKDLTSRPKSVTRRKN